ncbi:SDR family NAD(P)-dependent oxidoreductase [Actinomadura xylanilytica]|uniref:SDR family NAD(P)-dependent oxidoreductase n=1 Tax=Actinomadura xylanilytica TaxID=887459 RepID=UPI00255A9F4C|nr:SDR family NAD(P)-dependent oxidoreductase [Actinomadura xylanilytica]MDL4773337.1 SDR family NAD(P)-dependent oxidoreductase [Actinomadura xylanilytica]
MTQKTALITGASRGLGRALAHELGRAGWNLIIGARDARVLDDAALRDLVTGRLPSGRYRVADLSRSAAAGA